MHKYFVYAFYSLGNFAHFIIFFFTALRKCQTTSRKKKIIASLCIYEDILLFYEDILLFFSIDSKVFKAFCAYLLGSLFEMTFVHFQIGFGKDPNKYEKVSLALIMLQRMSWKLIEKSPR